MSREDRKAELRAKSETLLQGSLKHVRTAALAAALVPLASVAVHKAVVTLNASGGATFTVPSPCDFTTSGGFVLKDSGKKATFGVHGGCKHGEFWGHLNFLDHETGYSVDSLEILGYMSSSGTGPTTRDICGTATTNGAEGQPVYFRVRLVDNGEPGVADQFGIRLSNGWGVPTRLLNGGQNGGGDVQLHEPNPSTSGPDPSPDELAMCNGVEAP
jgi:hypothetical protein